MVEVFPVFKEDLTCKKEVSVVLGGKYSNDFRGCNGILAEDYSFLKSLENESFVIK